MTIGTFAPGIKYWLATFVAMDFDVVLEEGDDGVWIADVPALPGCHTQGDSKEDVIENIKDAIRLYLDVEGRPTSLPKMVTLTRVSVEA